ncbi:hypothetical protein ACJX0J_042466 [Zea mays]
MFFFRVLPHKIQIIVLYSWGLGIINPEKGDIVLAAWNFIEIATCPFKKNFVACLEKAAMDRIRAIEFQAYQFIQDNFMLLSILYGCPCLHLHRVSFQPFVFYGENCRSNLELIDWQSEA